MAMEYRPNANNYNKPTDPTRCKASVMGSGRWPRSHQCTRKHKADGWCGQHHPDAEEARRQASKKRYHDELAARQHGRIVSGLRDASIDQLRAELARREEGK